MTIHTHPINSAEHLDMVNDKGQHMQTTNNRQISTGLA